MKPILATSMALLLAAASVGLPLAAATHCNPAAIVTPITDFGYHVTDGGLSEGYVLSGWIYMESNNVQGLQRGGSAMLNGASDPCQDSDTPDTLLSGLGIEPGDVPTFAPYPGWLLIVAGTLVPTTLYNPLGYDCTAFAPTPAGGSVTCQAPPPPVGVPPGFAAGCKDPFVFAGFMAPTAAGAGVTGTTSCAGGTASASCSTSAAGSACGATSPGAIGLLPITCSATLSPGSYGLWFTLCTF